MLIILSGKCSIKVGDKEFNSIGARKSVFEGRAFAVYVPPEHSFEIKKEEKCEIAFCGTDSDRRDIKPYLTIPEENVKWIYGKKNWEKEKRFLWMTRGIPG